MHICFSYKLLVVSYVNAFYKKMISYEVMVDFGQKLKALGGVRAFSKFFFHLYATL